MVLHLSSRLSWHDSGWNGCICKNPSHNVCCTIHDFIRDVKNCEYEDQNAGKKFCDIAILPPCSRDGTVFSNNEFTITHNDPLEWRKLPSVTEDIPPFSYCTSGYGRMFSESLDSVWENDPKKQAVRLNEFWRSDFIAPEKSLVFFYVKHGNPIKDDPGTRLLIGIGRLKQIGGQLYFGKKKPSDEENPLWSRCITLDPKQMVRIPYQEYVEKGYPTDKITCEIPSIALPSFSYVAEHVSNDIAVAVLECAIRSIKNVRDEALIPGNWSEKLNWLNQLLDECWKERGRYPGIGNILRSLGCDEGIDFHREVLSQMIREGEDPWDFLEEIFHHPERCLKKSFIPSLRKAAEMWKQYGTKKQILLKTLSQFELLKSQFDRVINTTSRKEADIIFSLKDRTVASDEQIIENPYLLCERDRGGKDQEIYDVSLPISFESIDHGLLPEGEAAKVKGSVNVIHQNDRRRIRALFVHLLKTRSGRGDTIVPFDELLVEATEYIPENRRCEPDIELIKNNLDFYLGSLRIDINEEISWAALDWIAEAEDFIQQTIENLIQKKLPESVNNWKAIIRAIPNAIASDADSDVIERALSGQAEALETTFRSRLSVIRGKAGTGKTTVIEALLQGIEKESKGNILLLAPTGKARVRLTSKTNREAKTIHQFLFENGWLRASNYSFKLFGGGQKNYSTVIIDEASMMPMDLFYYVLRSLSENNIRRLVLVGDPNQLPPIGPGKPFIDIIAWLENPDTISKYSKRVSILDERVRYRFRQSEALLLSDAFLGDSTSVNDDEILSRVSNQTLNPNSDLNVYFYGTQDDLNELLIKILGEKLNIPAPDIKGSYKNFNESFGIGTENPNIEKWQIISPVRGDLHGTVEINRKIQKAYKSGLMHHIPNDRPKPFGDEQIVYTDKVINIINQLMEYRRDNQNFKEYVANGEIGFVAGAQKFKHNGKNTEVAYVVFPKKSSDIRLKYYKNQVTSSLELAYAITVHKSQGSDFDIVIFVIPNKCRLLSRELMYTALTRFKERMIVLIEKDDSALINCRNPASSETIKRNTRLFGLKLRIAEDKPFLAQFLIHRTLKNILVRSKSEVIVANILSDLGIDYEYEKKLIPNPKKPNNYRLPDFTVTYAGDQYYWEHLGLLHLPKYKKDWDQKKRWYLENGFGIVGDWKEGQSDTIPKTKFVITSRDGADGSINAMRIKELATKFIIGLT